ncbi:MAG: SPFH domain-containing protein [Bacilli bacterium]|jgi:regulator of protease activity HflC (stomatin/prohibitin superfamily)
MFLAEVNVTVLVIVLVILFIVVALSLFSIRVVRQSEAIVVERLGKFLKVCGSGLNIIVPFFDRVVAKISLKERVADFPPQPVITKDNVTMQIDTVVYFAVTDPKLYCYGVERPMNAIENLTATTLRNIIGELELDETLTSRDTINSKMRSILDIATDPWGIKVHRVEVKNILPPRDIQEAMEKQMRAERERRESILRAEGEKTAAILTAQGQKESMILKAEAARQSTITEAEGRAEALRQLFHAQADAIRYINEAKPSKEYMTLEGFKALEKVADGKSTKLIIPSNLQDLAGTIASITEIIKEPKTQEEKKK